MRFDTRGFTKKPGDKVIVERDGSERTINEATGVTYRLNRVENKEFNDFEIIDNIQNGKTFILENINGNRKQDNFISTKWIGIDMDEEGCSPEKTIEILEKNGFKFFLLYKTFSYGEIKKHRVLLKMDRELNREEALLIYAKLNSILNLDTSCTNLCRLWYATNKEIEIDHMPLETTVYGDLDLSGVIISQRRKSSFGGSYMPRNGDFNEDLKVIVDRLDFNKFKKRIRVEIKEWSGYQEIRSGIYAACLILFGHNKDGRGIEHFIKCLDDEYKETYVNYFKYDLLNGKYTYSKAIKILKEYASVEVKEVEQVRKV